MVSESTESATESGSVSSGEVNESAIAVSNIAQEAQGAAIALYRAGKQQDVAPANRQGELELDALRGNDALALHKDKASKQFDFSKLVQKISDISTQGDVGVLLSLSRADAGDFYALMRDDVDIGYDGRQGVIRISGGKEAVSAFMAEVYFYGNNQSLKHFYFDVNIIPKADGSALFNAVSNANANAFATESINARVFMLYEPDSGFYVAYQGSSSSGAVPVGSDLMTLATPEGGLQHVLPVSRNLTSEQNSPLDVSSEAAVVAPSAAEDLDPENLLGAGEVIRPEVTELTPSLTDALFTNATNASFSGAGQDWHLGDVLPGGAGTDTLTINAGVANANLDAPFVNVNSIDVLQLNANGAHQITVGDAYFDRGDRVEGDVFSVSTTSNVGVTIDGTAIADAQHRLNITTDGGADSIVGGAGNDIINVGAGQDTIQAGAGDDQITMAWDPVAGIPAVPTAIAGASLAAWFDASDASTLFSDAGVTAANVGDQIAYWADKSGRGNDAQDISMGSAADRPTYEAAQIGAQNALDFAGAGDRLDIINLDLLRNVSGATVFAVFQRDGALNANRDTLFVATNGLSAGSGRVTLSVQSAGDLTIGGRRLDADGFTEVRGASAALGEAIIQSGRVDYANNDAFLYKNGTLANSDLNYLTAGNTSNTASAGITLGSYPNGGLSFTGDIAEIIVYDSALTLQQQQDVELYLSNKYAIGVPHAVPVLDGIVNGGAGNDSLAFSSGTVNVTFDGSNQITEIEQFSFSGNDAAHNITVVDGYYAAGAGVQGNMLTLDFSGNANAVVANGAGVTGANVLRVLLGNGNDVLTGNGSNVIADYSNAAASVNVQLGLGAATGQGADTLQNVEHAQGSVNNDTLEGGNDSQTLVGGDGDDIIIGGVDVASFDITRVANTIIWMDAADASTITDAAGALTQWNDKSGNGYHMIANGGEEPVTGANTINGLNVVTNAAGDRVYHSATPVNEFGNAVSVFSVVESSNINNKSILSYATAGSNNEYLVFGTSVFVNGSQRGGAIPNYGDGNPHVVHTRWRSSDGTLEGSVDNGAITSFVHQAGAPLEAGGGLSVGGEQDAVGGNFDNNQDFVGDIGEVIVFSEYVTDDERDLINLYLTDKWALGAAVSDNDSLDGGAGNDRLDGGLGADSLTGGTGNDIFLFDQAHDSGTGAGNRDVISDFTTGQDRIDLSGIVGLSAISADNTAGNGIADFTGAVGQVAWGASGANVIVFADFDGDSAADFEIELQNIATLRATDFLF